MNTEHGLLSVALLTLVFILAFNFPFVLVESSECLDSGQNHGDSDVYTPANCRPTECSVTGAYNHSTKYLQCSVKNYENHFPNACDKIKEEISSQSLEPREHHAFQEACQARLASISLFMFHCQPLTVTTPEVSLNFTFHFPLCGEDNTTSASSVMVEFSAGKESIDNYFAHNHICRVFDFSGSSFSQLTHDDQIQLSYDCIAIGLRDGHSGHLEYYYYLSFATFPAGDTLKYALVYQDVSSSSMQLVAAAWRSTSRVHVVFQPISGVTEYAVAAGCLQRNIFAQVISSSSVEISDIPPECSIVSVSVKPNAPECQTKGMTCSPIKVTLLDKTELQLPEEPRQTQEYGWLWSGRMIVLVVIIGLIILSILVAVVLHHKKKHAVKKRQASMPYPRREAQPTSLDHRFMYRRAWTKLAMRVHVLSCRTWGTGVMEGSAPSALFYIDLLPRCGDVEPNPGPPKLDSSLKQTRLRGASDGRGTATSATANSTPGQPSPTRNPFPPPAKGPPTNKRPARPPPPPPPSLSPLSSPLKDIAPKQTAQKPPESTVQVPCTSLTQMSGPPSTLRPPPRPGRPITPPPPPPHPPGGPKAPPTPPARPPTPPLPTLTSLPPKGSADSGGTRDQMLEDIRTGKGIVLKPVKIPEEPKSSEEILKQLFHGGCHHTYTRPYTRDNENSSEDDDDDDDDDDEDDDWDD